MFFQKIIYIYGKKAFRVWMANQYCIVLVHKLLQNSNNMLFMQSERVKPVYSQLYSCVKFRLKNIDPWSQLNFLLRAIKSNSNV